MQQYLSINIFIKYGIALLLGSCLAWVLPPDPAAGAETLKLGGTGAALGPMQLLARAFEKEHPSVKVEIFPSLGSGGAVKAVDRGALDIGFISRPLSDEELKLGLSVGGYAQTPFIAVTNPGAGVKGVSLEEVVRIYDGSMMTWPDGQLLRLILRPSVETDTALIRNLSPEMNRAVNKALSRPGLLMAMTDQENAGLIEKTPGAFGFMTLAQVISEKRHVTVLSLNGVVPDLQALETGKYQLSKKLSFVTAKTPPPLVGKFIAFMRSPAGRKILRENGNIPFR